MVFFLGDRDHENLVVKAMIDRDQAVFTKIALTYGLFPPKTKRRVIKDLMTNARGLDEFAKLMRPQTHAFTNNCAFGLASTPSISLSCQDWSRTTAGLTRAVCVHGLKLATRAVSSRTVFCVSFDVQ